MRGLVPAADGQTLVFAGEVVRHRGGAATRFSAVSIHRVAETGGLPSTPDVLELRCEPRDLPESRNAPAATGLDHVVHVLCSHFEEPEAIERFMTATRGMSDDYVLGREAWLEVLDHPSDRGGGPPLDPVVDDIYLGRYPSVEAWDALHALPDWEEAVTVMESEATTLFHLLVAPTVNRIAAYR
ncbi:MAG: hypothetical protein AAF480_10785 [Actinomycetota bacterium]